MTDGRSQEVLPPYRRPAEEVVAWLKSDARKGLSSADAKARLASHGPNELAQQKPVPAWKKLLVQFRDPLVILLLLAALMASSVLWVREVVKLLRRLRVRTESTRVR
jgi:Ca2+-transporting ATPase